MSFPRYPEYKDSGVEWLGEIPAHWDITRIGYESWVRARLGWKGLKADEYVDDGYIFLATPNIKGKQIDFENVNYIDEHRFNESPEIKLKIGDVLLAKDGSTLGTTNVVRTLPLPATVNSSIAVISPSTNLSGEYLFYFFQSFYFENIVQSLKGGMGVPHLFQHDINKIHLLLPILEDQNRIVSFLDRETSKIDDLVAEQEKLIELLKEKRQAIISHAVTKGLDPTVPMKDSGIKWLGEVPEHWGIIRLSKISIKITNGYVGPTRDILVDTGIRYLQSLHIKNNRILFNDPYYVTEEWSAQHEKSILQIGDVLIVQTGDIGQVAVVTEDFVGCNCHALIIVSPNKTIVSGEWLSIVLNSDYGYHSLISIQTGALHPHLNCGNVKDLIFPVPPVSEQQQITNFLKSELVNIDSLIVEAQRAIELLKERRSALISAAVTGKIDVRGLVPQEVIQEVTV